MPTNMVPADSLRSEIGSGHRDLTGVEQGKQQAASPSTSGVSLPKRMLGPLLEEGAKALGLGKEMALAAAIEERFQRLLETAHANRTGDYLQRLRQPLKALLNCGGKRHLLPQPQSFRTLFEQWS